MSGATYRVTRFDPSYDLSEFDCGVAAYNDWLSRHAANTVAAGVAAVYLLIETKNSGERVVGYFAINPTQVLREVAPRSMSRGWPATVPAWKLGKLAIHRDLRGAEGGRWGRDLLREALETIVRVADAGGGKVIVVDADNGGLVDFYLRNGFKSTGVDGELSLYMKVSTARRALFD